MPKILVTGSAGFIGFHTVNKLLEKNFSIVGLDNINEYYSIELKYARLAQHGIEKDRITENLIIQSNLHPNYSFIKISIEDKEQLFKLFESEGFDYVINLAAQAGTRYSLALPQAYINSNIIGFFNILEACRHYPVKHLVFASSSSVYGLNKTMPFSVKDNVDHPVSLYAATKKSNELMAHTYSYLFMIPTTGLRFFTVYGPWGRPDMAFFIFTDSIINNKPIQVFNFGNMSRDFTYIEDITTGIMKVILSPPAPDDKWTGEKPDPSGSTAPYKIYNIGNNKPVKLTDFIEVIEKSIGKKAIIEYLPMQLGDVPSTFADISSLSEDFDFKPETDIIDGINKFITWYKSYYKIS